MMRRIKGIQKTHPRFRPTELGILCKSAPNEIYVSLLLNSGRVPSVKGANAAVRRRVREIMRSAEGFLAQLCCEKLCTVKQTLSVEKTEDGGKSKRTMEP
mmetsp:Transcript_23372/g.50483  ORF Transcript_23372/g.50483 Transcript_23372/m.50483 type:complete len:100 (-) Transcript_23372:87-386(-)